MVRIAFQIRKEIKMNEGKQNNLFGAIRQLIAESRNHVFRAVNKYLIELHWNIGQMDM